MAEPDNLLDREQIAALLEVLTAEDWRMSLASFAETGRQTVDTLVAQARAGEAHNRTAHTLKGMALNLGAAALGRLAKELEHGPPDLVLLHAERLKDVLERSLTLMDQVTQPV